MAAPGESPGVVLSVPEIRDYQRINAELVRLLDRGQAAARLSGVEGQRLLVAGLRGPWTAVIEVEGRAGPELAADLDAPGLTIVVRGDVADGAARGLRAGRVLVVGDAADALSTTQSGGTVLVTGSAGHRAGLALAGGTLAILGGVGRLAGERQAGGRIFVRGESGPHASFGRRGGRLVRLPREDEPDPLADVAEDDRVALGTALAEFPREVLGGGAWWRLLDALGDDDVMA